MSHTCSYTCEWPIWTRIADNLEPSKRVFFKSKANGQVITGTEPGEKACMGDYNAGEKQLFDIVQSASK